VRIANGSKEKLTLAWLDIRRDWGWAPDYVEAMRRMWQQKKPDDYVVATGEEHSLQQFVNEAFRHLGQDWKKHVVSDRKLFRPSDIERSCGNALKSRRKLGFRAKVGFKEIISTLIQRDQIRK
jgi:GDPmannose 4,6-dehydratase